jgi:hypothetical protein
VQSASKSAAVLEPARNRSTSPGHVPSIWLKKSSSRLLKKSLAARFQDGVVAVVEG